MLVTVIGAVATGTVQKIAGLDSPKSPSSTPTGPYSATPDFRSGKQHKDDLLIARTATAIDLDRDIWVAEAPLNLSPVQSQQVSQIMKSSFENGDLGRYGRYMEDLGAIRADHIAIDLNLSTDSIDQVRLNRVRIARQCHAAPNGTLFLSPPAGPAEPIAQIGFSLDETVPIARKIGSGGDYFADYVQYIKKGDDSTYKIIIRTAKKSCDFRLLLDVSQRDKSQVLTVDNQGRPFRVSASLQETSATESIAHARYQRLYVRGAGDFKQRGYGWHPEDPKAYKPSG